MHWVVRALTASELGGRTLLTAENDRTFFTWPSAGQNVCREPRVAEHAARISASITFLNSGKARDRTARSAFAKLPVAFGTFQWFPDSVFAHAAWCSSRLELRSSFWRSEFLCSDIRRGCTFDYDSQWSRFNLNICLRLFMIADFIIFSMNIFTNDHKRFFFLFFRRGAPNPGHDPRHCLYIILL